MDLYTHTCNTYASGQKVMSVTRLVFIMHKCVHSPLWDVSSSLSSPYLLTAEKSMHLLQLYITRKSCHIITVHLLE